MTFLSFILSLYTTIRPKISVLINLFFYLYMTIRPKVGVTLILKFIIFLIEPIFCLQYCLYISWATIIPLYFVYYIHRSVLLLYSVHYIHGYMKSQPSRDRFELPLVIYSMPGKNATLRINFSDLSKRNFVRSLFETVFRK